MSFCTYCGRPQGDRIGCCGENHWMTAEEFKDYHGDWPDDGEDHDDYQAEAIATARSEQAFADNERAYRV